MGNVASLTTLNGFTASRYASLTLPMYRSAMAWFDGTCGMVAVGAAARGEPVGLAVGRSSNVGIAEIVSVYVVPDFRNRGIGSRLLSRLEAELVMHGQHCAELSHTLGTDLIVAVERLLRKCNWPAEGDRLHVFVADGRITTASWFNAAVLPTAYAITSWATVSPEERHGLAELQRMPSWCPEYLLPLRFETNLEMLNSLVLRHNGIVIGWLLTKRLDATTIEYANLYVRPSLNRVGHTFASVALLAEGVRRETRALGITSRGVFGVRPENEGLLRFIDRHMRAFVLSRKTVQRLHKRFRPIERTKTCS